MRIEHKEREIAEDKKLQEYWRAKNAELVFHQGGVSHYLRMRWTMLIN
jgi:hypothetical protein